MENEKKVVKLAEEQLGQVAGGTQFYECPYFQELLNAKERCEMGRSDESEFQEKLRRTLSSLCPNSADIYHCYDCQNCHAPNEWSKEYGV